MFAVRFTANAKRLSLKNANGPTRFFSFLTATISPLIRQFSRIAKYYFALEITASIYVAKSTPRC